MTVLCMPLVRFAYCYGFPPARRPRRDSRRQILDGFLGEQFGLPVAVESLRVTRKLPPTGETVTLSAADPLNLVGIVVPGERVPAISGRTVAFRDGVAVDPELTPLRFVNLAPSPSAYSAD